MDQTIEEILRDTRFYELLLGFDRQMADAAHAARCHKCGAALHWGSYQRKPRGAAAGLGPEHRRRFSLCCAQDGCRKRETPGSLRFLGRKVYFGAMVVLISAMQSGLSAVRMKRLKALVGVSRRTVMRWREWWHGAFAESPFWRAHRALAPRTSTADLPASLLQCFDGAVDRQLILLLRFLTLERWLHKARKENRDPVRVLRRKVRSDVGAQESMSLAIREALRAQYAGHMSWSVALHHLNLRALAEQRPELAPVPSYSTIRRFLKAQGLYKRRRLSARRTAGVERAEARVMQREVRSYEADYVGSLWHVDAHHGSLKVVTSRGEWFQPVLFGVIDDRSRLLCHLQWSRTENAENVVHGLLQALLRRGLPRAVLSDNGTAMCAEEITEGLARLGILHERTLAFSPYQNAKIETLWRSVEGQLMAMLESVSDLTLEFLNEATQAWAEFGYNRVIHSEIGQTPLARWAAGPDVLRASPDSAALRLSFTRTERRTQRRSDGTLVIDARRFEVPNALRHLERVLVRYARWDLSQVHLVDEHSGLPCARLYPLDKAANANGIRRPLEPVATGSVERAGLVLTPASGIAPLLENLIAQQRATGLPPPYLPKDEPPDEEGET